MMSIYMQDTRGSFKGTIQDMLFIKGGGCKNH